MTLVLGIESSCDETAAAVVRDGRDVLSSVVVSQVDEHARYGGVVPEIAGRSHLRAILHGLLRLHNLEPLYPFDVYSRFLWRQPLT